MKVRTLYYANSQLRLSIDQTLMEYCLETRVDVNDELAIQLAQRKEKKIRDDAMRQRVNEAMGKRMDTGVRAMD